MLPKSPMRLLGCTSFYFLALSSDLSANEVFTSRDLMPPGCSRELYDAGVAVATEGQRILREGGALSDGWFRSREADLLERAEQVWGAQNIQFERVERSRKISGKSRLFRALRVLSTGEGYLNRKLRDYQVLEPNLELLWAPFLVYPFSPPRTQIIREKSSRLVALPLELASDVNSVDGRIALRHEFDHSSIDQDLRNKIESPYHPIIARVLGTVMKKGYVDFFWLQELYTYERDLRDLKRWLENLGIGGDDRIREFVLKQYRATKQQLLEYVIRTQNILDLAAVQLSENPKSVYFVERVQFYNIPTGYMTVSVPSEIVSGETDVLQLFVPLVKSPGLKKSDVLSNRLLFLKSLNSTRDKVRSLRTQLSD